MTDPQNPPRPHSERSAAQPPAKAKLPLGCAIFLVLLLTFIVLGSLTAFFHIANMKND